MKRIKWILGGLAVLLVMAVIIVFMSLNSIVRSQIETQASSSLSLKTTLRSASVSLFGGSLGLNDLAIASPEGFAAPQMFELNGANVGVSLGNLRSDPITIDKIVIDKPRLVIEQANGKFNFKVLMDKPSQPAPAGSQPIKLIIKDLAIKDAQVIIKPGIPGLATEIAIPIPTVEVKDVGTGDGNQNGVAIKEVVMLMITTLAEKAAENDKLPADVKSLLKLDVDQISRQVQAQVGKKIDAIQKDATKQVEKAIEKGLGDVLNKLPGQQQPKPPAK